MSETNYPGINYAGPGSITNMDAETGIRYGVISQHSLDSEACQSVYDLGTDLSFGEYRGSCIAEIKSALSDYFSDYKHEGKPSRLEQATQDAFAAIEDDFNEGYESDNPRMRYEQEGYIIQSCLDSDFFVIKSPFYTYAQFCSPCVPGGCNLDSPLELTRDAQDKPIDPIESNRCYCLGHDWFEGGKAPYAVFSVKTGEEVHPEK